MGRSKKNKTEDKRLKFKSLMKIIAGVDEVGRGSLIGPVYAAAVILNKSINSKTLKDSKTLTKEKREILFNYIKKNSIWATGKASVKEIDKINILQASLLAMKRAIKKLKKKPSQVLIDGNKIPDLKNYNLKAIEYYSQIIETLDVQSELRADLFYRRGGSYERLGDYKKADEDLLNSLKINPDDAYVLNYLAYSWLERDYKIDESMEMLKRAYELKSNDPYIIDSIGWAYYLIDDYIEAEKYLKRAVELMPEDPIVNDHYGDILWKLNRKIQARYFWNNVLKFDDTEDSMRNKINIKVIEGLKNS